MEESSKKYKNIINNGEVFGSKVTNISNVCELEGFLGNTNIVFIVEIKDTTFTNINKCDKCNHVHDMYTDCVSKNHHK